MKQCHYFFFLIISFKNAQLGYNGNEFNIISSIIQYSIYFFSKRQSEHTYTFLDCRVSQIFHFVINQTSNWEVKQQSLAFFQARPSLDSLGSGASYQSLFVCLLARWSNNDGRWPINLCQGLRWIRKETNIYVRRNQTNKQIKHFS